jgi:hypothetical protein
MNDHFPLYRVIAGEVSRYAAWGALIGGILFACHLVGPLFVLVPLTILAICWAFA